MIVRSVGHSNRTLDELVTLLRDSGITLLADVRRFPASRRHPCFRREALARGLEESGIDYEWLGESLGGRVPASLPAKESPNRAWEVAAFRNYADAMPRPEFQEGIARLERLADEKPTAFLCAERLWWQCHRRLIADALAVRGATVVHLLEPGKSMPHELTPWARVENGVLTYPGLL